MKKADKKELERLREQYKALKEKTQEEKEELEEKKEEIKEETTEEPKKELTMEDVIKDLYSQLKILSDEINTLKMNQLWIQKFVTNAMKK